MNAWRRLCSAAGLWAARAADRLCREAGEHAGEPEPEQARGGGRGDEVAAAAGLALVVGLAAASASEVALVGFATTPAVDASAPARPGASR